jgi:hypothetical protein
MPICFLDAIALPLFQQKVDLLKAVFMNRSLSDRTDEIPKRFYRTAGTAGIDFAKAVAVSADDRGPEIQIEEPNQCPREKGRARLLSQGPGLGQN